MSQWKNDDSAANSVAWSPALVKLPAISANRDNMFGNVTPDAFVDGQVVGIFGVSTAEAGSANGTIVGYIEFAGSGYGANATLTVAGGTGNSTAASGNAHANSSGRIDSVLFSNIGADYSTPPTLTIAAPAAVTFNGLTAVSNTNNTIALTTANSKFLVGDRVQYLVAAGNTAVDGLANAEYYYIAFSNTTVVTLALTAGGANIDLTASVSETGHSLTGETATASAVVSRGKHVAHAGWVKRTVGTGGRAGRVQYETLVAMGSMTGDASDDAILKDA